MAGAPIKIPGTAGIVEAKTARMAQAALQLAIPPLCVRPSGVISPRDRGAGGLAHRRCVTSPTNTLLQIQAHCSGGSDITLPAASATIAADPRADLTASSR